jgi:hypothetical protein
MTLPRDPSRRRNGAARADRLRAFEPRSHHLRLAEDLPIIIEIVDTEAKIKAFLPTLDTMVTSGLVTLEKVQVLLYGAHVKHEPA